MSLVRASKLFSSPLLQASKFFLSSSSHAPQNQTRPLVASLIPQAQGNVYSYWIIFSPNIFKRKTKQFLHN